MRSRLTEAWNTVQAEDVRAGSLSNARTLCRWKNVRLEEVEGADSTPGESTGPGFRVGVVHSNIG